LPGESRKTGEINFEVLRQVAQEGLMLRRINIRQVMVFPGTPLWEYRNTHALKFFKKEFAAFKKKVRTQLDPVFLQRVFPLGTRLSNVITEFHDGNITFGRQMGTYPVLVGIREKLPLGQSLNVRVTEYGMRSLTGEVVG
ncbi:MAG TPA: radical SAM protein, partial [Thermotogota bacterium]|nr:radical SAM protein [Thermotogota bacterium]